MVGRVCCGQQALQCSLCDAALHLSCALDETLSLPPCQSVFDVYRCGYSDSHLLGSQAHTVPAQYLSGTRVTAAVLTHGRTGFVFCGRAHSMARRPSWPSSTRRVVRGKGTS